MSTLKEVKGAYDAFKFGTKLFGATKEANAFFQEKLNAVGQAICLERQIKAEEAMLLPDETLLGEQSEAKFQELKDWIASLRR
ncbi:MAG: hypothetical protein WC528_01555 [Patescibacteria group bacterium]